MIVLSLTLGFLSLCKNCANFFFFNYLFIYLLLAVLGLRCCARAFSSCGERGPLFIAVRGPLTVVEHRLQTRRLSSCGSRAQLLRGMWNLPRPGLEPVSPALAGGFSTTAPPGKPKTVLILTQVASFVSNKIRRTRHLFKSSLGSYKLFCGFKLLIVPRLTLKTVWLTKINMVLFKNK